MRAILPFLPGDELHDPRPDRRSGQTIPIPSVGGMSTADRCIHPLQGRLPGRHGFDGQLAYPAGTVAYTSPSGAGASGQTIVIYVSNGQPPRPEGGGGDGGGDGNGGGNGGNGGGNGGNGGGNGNGGGGGGNGGGNGFPDFPR